MRGLGDFVKDFVSYFRLTQDTQVSQLEASHVDYILHC